MESYFKKHSMAYRATTNGEFVLRDCPSCHETHGKPDNLWKLYFAKSSGVFFCHRCGAKGSWFDFKANRMRKSADHHTPPSVQPLSDALPKSSSSAAAPATATTTTTTTTTTSQAQMEARRPNQKTARGYHRQLFEDAKYAHVLDYLTGTASSQQRHLSPVVLKKYRVGVAEYQFAERDEATGGVRWEPHTCITFPWIGADDGSVAPSAGGDEAGLTKLCYLRLKVRSMKNKACMRLDPAGGEWGFFGWHTVPADATEIVITEGEYDAMAVHQVTKMPTVSLPNGARSLPVALLPHLERFQRIYLWMDDDVAGQEGARIFAEKLGVGRCLVVSTRGGASTGPKDANDALRLGLDLKQMIKQARPIPHKQIMTFDDIRLQVHRELTNPQQVAGIQSKLLPSLTNTLKGHRPGELSVFTGPTGMGKTTLLSLLSLDFAMQGVSTLWGSFELSNVRLIKKMLNQFAGKNLADPAHLADFDFVADQFRELPIYLLRFWGSTNVEAIIEAMEYAVYVHDVRHVVLDNLQFMCGSRAVGVDKFQVLDHAIEQFRVFASHKNVHISLVIHPRKQAEHVQLNMSDVFGSAKAIQEADNVIILQSKASARLVEVKKNRFDGSTGSFPVVFDRTTDRFRELNAEEMKRFIEAETPPPPQQQRYQTQKQPQPPVPAPAPVTPSAPFTDFIIE